MIVDGGLGLELERRGFVYTTRLWSGQAVLTRPDLLLDIHRAFLAAGADVIETATYQLSHATLRELGYDDAGIDAVFARAVALAREAIALHRASVDADAGADRVLLVAGSMGPHGATVGDGSEYAAVAHLDRAGLAAFHAERVRSLSRAQPDVYLFETIPTRVEAIIAAQTAGDAGIEPVWISLSTPNGERLYDGTPLSDVAAELAAFAGVAVIGVNCLAPAAAAPALRALARASAKPALVCPNLGQHWDGAAHGLTGGSGAAEFLSAVPEWLALGACHIGGCCGVGPETIAQLAARVTTAQRV